VEAGAFIGVVVGLIAGIIAAILINAVFDPKSDVKAILPWIVTMLVPVGAAIWQQDWIKNEMTQSKSLIPSFCVTFLLTILYPAVRMILRVGHNLGQGSKSESKRYLDYSRRDLFLCRRRVYSCNSNCSYRVRPLVERTRTQLLCAFNLGHPIKDRWRFPYSYDCLGHRRRINRRC